MEQDARVINRYNLYLDSSQRDGGTPADWWVSLRTPIVQSNRSNWFRLSVDSLEVPFAWKQVRGASVEATVSHSGGSKTDILVLPDNNYTVVSLLATLSSLLQGLAVYAGLATLDTAFTWSTSTLEVTLGLKTDGVTVALAMASSPIGGYLGFDSDVTFSTATPATGTNPLNVGGSRCLYLRSRDLQPRNSYEALLQREDLSDVLAKVPIGVNFGSYIMAAPRTVTFITNDSLDRLGFYLTDNQSRDPLPLSLDWSLHVTIEEVGRARDGPAQGATPATSVTDALQKAQLSAALLAERRQLEGQVRQLREELAGQLRSKTPTE